MTHRLLSLALVGALCFPALAYDRGSVLIETWAQRHGTITKGCCAAWIGWPEFPSTASVCGTALIYKPIPWGCHNGHFILPATDQFIFHYNRTVSFWNGVSEYFGLPGKGYDDIFTADTELSEFAPMRSGNFLVAERSNDATAGAKLIEFNLRGRVADHPFPTLIDPRTGRALGARHIELLGDSCTLLYTLGADDPEVSRVRRMNVCTDQALPDFASLLPRQYAGAIRQLPNGDVLVANGSTIMQFHADGMLWIPRPFPGIATHLALSADGETFWAAGLNQKGDYTEFRYYDPRKSGEPQSIMIGNPGMQSLDDFVDVDDLAVVGEWRAALQGRHRRAVRRR